MIRPPREGFKLSHHRSSSPKTNRNPAQTVRRLNTRTLGSLAPCVTFPSSGFRARHDYQPRAGCMTYRNSHLRVAPAACKTGSGATAHGPAMSENSFPSHTDFLGHYDYSFDWPQGTVRARLDARAWGRNRNLFPYFTDMRTQEKRLISVFWDKGYCIGKDGLSFRHDVQEGEVLELEIGATRNGRLKLVSARKTVELPA
jgi:hypothetical protein